MEQSSREFLSIVVLLFVVCVHAECPLGLRTINYDLTLTWANLHPLMPG